MKYKEIPNSLYYGVSEGGEVVRFPHMRMHNINKTEYLTKLKILKPSANNSKGYLRLRIQYKDGSSITESVHRLVAKVYIPNPNNLPQINHIDGNKLNNNVKNLEWCTNSYNQEHAALYLNRQSHSKGINHHSNKLDESKIISLSPRS